MKYIFVSLVLLPFSLMSQLNKVVETWNKSAEFKQASISFCVINNTNGEVIASQNEHVSLVPASTLKIVSTTAALALLGSDFKYATKLYYRGNFDKSSGVLDGDLIISGSGDPSLQSENFNKDSESVVQQWAKILKEKGLKQIKGQIIGDGSAFERRVPNNWIWEDISNYYGAVPNGLSYSDNKIKINYSSGASGSLANIISMYPNYFSKQIQINSSVTAGSNKDNAYAYGDPFSFDKEIKGTIPANKKTYEIEIVLPDPALLCAEQVCEALINAGIVCEKKRVSSTYNKLIDLERAQLVYTHFSPSLDKIIYYTNQTSNNHYCESLLYTLGNGNPETGILKIKKYWQQQGLDTSEIYLEDASGLGRINTLTSYFQAKALYKISNMKEIYLILNNSLPIAGKQSSMRNLGKGSFIENNLRAKTGYMKRVRAYCGYLKSKTGKELSYSIIVNNYACSALEAKSYIEKFLIALAEL